ncbi:MULTISPECIES: DUF1761 domain-containing protein [unclassified Rathayibacter]|uniref:DUF1761 domain-containing protein n=1 Tax=unclassified Rathayibacter TaxID=2609250 RepID=UPI00188CE026|nr:MULTISPECIES: DUF1761 domain-containing protein [unclassified Rathayibacter]MBF4461127.1 DUF1761 domain-containing protein [Rathayibacter sp. VKM Ac-2879]MBF4502538.1 DUF1761 domain-containing protein [Rathayibacter sp. VKM Ac-2878]
MVPDINPWAVALATLSTMVVGSIWYTPKVFGALWMRLIGMSHETMRARSALVPILVTLVVSFVTALVLAGCVDIAHSFYGGSWFANALVTGLFLFAGFTAARFVTHDAFEGRPVALTVLNVTHELVTVLVMSVVIGLLPA